MNTAPSSTPHRSSKPPSATRASVLAGGGAAGNAWELGLIAGLSEAGVDVTEADLIIGTSAGSTVAAQSTSGIPPAVLYAAILAEVPRPAADAAGSKRGLTHRFSGPNDMEWSDGIIGSAADASDMRRRMGAAALEMDAPDGFSQTRWRNIVAARLPSYHWPQQPVLIIAVDARTGQPVVLDRDSGIHLVDAVAASTSAMTPFRIGDNRYINGGYRRSENADLAAGCGLVLVLSPFSGRTRMPLEWGSPDSSAGDVFDANALDPSTRLQAASRPADFVWGPGHRMRSRTPICRSRLGWRQPTGHAAEGADTSTQPSCRLQHAAARAGLRVFALARALVGACEPEVQVDQRPAVRACALR